jgi:protein-tyrosine phosphatase
MDWVTESIAIGNYIEARDDALIRHCGFRSLLSLDGSVEENEASALGFDLIVAVKLIDGPGNDLAQFRYAVESLVDLAEPSHDSSPILVHCHAGRSRSVAVVAGYLKHTRHLSVAAAIAHIADRREIALAPELRALLALC